jgi:methionyl-tRNA formyltransferase
LSTVKIVFFGTGQTSLDALIELDKNFTIEAVITKPATKTSSGGSRPTNVELWAKKMNLRVFNPANKKDLSELVTDQKFSSNVAVVLDYGFIIPQTVIDSFNLGILNSHFSLLPIHRGADPIRSAILAGDKTTGVTIIKIVAELDAGPILTWAEYDLGDNITEPELRIALSELNISLLTETLKLYIGGDIDPIDQDSASATYTHKTSKQDGQIDSTKSAEQIEREIRAYQGWPKSFFSYKNKIFSIIQAKHSSKTVSAGKLEQIDKHLYLGCKDSSIEIIKIQPAGKPALSALDFINGYQNIIGK